MQNTPDAECSDAQYQVNAALQDFADLQAREAELLSQTLKLQAERERLQGSAAYALAEPALECARCEYSAAEHKMKCVNLQREHSTIGVSELLPAMTSPVDPRLMPTVELVRTTVSAANVSALDLVFVLLGEGCLICEDREGCKTRVQAKPDKYTPPVKLMDCPDCGEYAVQWGCWCNQCTQCGSEQVEVAWF